MSEADLEKFQRGLAHLAPQTVLSDFRALLAKALGLDFRRPADARSSGSLETSLEVETLSR